jgi:predicted metalloendopeptidase
LHHFSFVLLKSADGFDDQGRKYNWQGQLEDWWTERDAAEYEKRVEVMVEQANAFQVTTRPCKAT